MNCMSYNAVIRNYLFIVCKNAEGQTRLLLLLLDTDFGLPVTDRILAKYKLFERCRIHFADNEIRCFTKYVISDVCCDDEPRIYFSTHDLNFQLADYGEFQVILRYAFFLCTYFS